MANFYIYFCLHFGSRIPDITCKINWKQSMELILILILIMLGWFWIDSLDKRERAIALGTELAARFNLQMLDETVMCSRIWLGRNRKGHVQLLRTYAFDVSATGDDRLHCHLVLLGNHLSVWHIPPYLHPAND